MARARSRSGQGEAAPSDRRAAIYSRISKLDDIRTASLNTQEDGGVEKARTEGFARDRIDTFRERFKGEELWYRPVLSVIRKAIREGKYRLLVCHCLDRLARDPVDQVIVIKEAKRSGCEVLFVTETFEDTMEGDLLRYSKGFAAKLEISSIKERTNRGRIALLDRGKLTQQGYPPFGYRFTQMDLPAKDRSRRAREIDTEAAEIVRRIYLHVAADGYTPCAIAMMFNVEGVLSPRAYRGHIRKDGTEFAWHASTIRNIIQNETYLGGTVERYGKTKCIGISQKGRAIQVDLPREEWQTYELDEPTPAIVDRALWDRANERISKSERAAKKRNGRVPRLLRGLIFCANCGHRMFPAVALGQGTTTKGKKFHYYQCGSPRTKTLGGKRCGAKMTPAEMVEDLVWDQVKKWFADRDRLREEFERARERSKNLQLIADLESVREEITKQDRLRQVASSKWGETVALGDEDQATIFETQMTLATARLKALREREAKIAGRLVSGERIEAGLAAFEAALDSASEALTKGEITFEEKRALLEGLQVQVVADGRWAKARYFVHSVSSS